MFVFYANKKNKTSMDKEPQDPNGMKESDRIELLLNLKYFAYDFAIITTAYCCAVYFLWPKKTKK